MPTDLYQKHFNAAIECFYLKKRIEFMLETEVWDFEIPWTSLASKYEALLMDQKKANSTIQIDHWAYQKASTSIEEREREKPDKSVRVGEGTMQRAPET